jgi:flagellar export protein FliJ
MNRTLEKLAQMAQMKLDQHRQALNDLETMKADLVRRISDLDEQIHREMSVAQSDPLATQGLGRFLTVTRDRQARLRSSVAEVDAQIEQAREQVSEAFRERKRYEHVLDNRRSERRRRLDRAEQARMDEIGLRRARPG